MDMVADVVTRILSIRETRQIRVRQPLRRLFAVCDDDQTLDILRRYEEHVKDELNIKKIELLHILEFEHFKNYSVSGNSKSIGPKFKDKAKLIQKQLEEISKQRGEVLSKIVLAHQNGQSYCLTIDGDTYDLDARKDIAVTEHLPEFFVIDVCGNPTLYLDIEITDELKREGRARDIVRHIQQTRKDTGLEIQDHIRLQLGCAESDLQTAIAEHKEYICRETLCDEFEVVDSLSDATKEIKLGGYLLQLRVEKK